MFFLLLVPFKAPAESVTCEPSHWAEKSDEYETRYTLRDSTAHSPWLGNCVAYNAYGYVLGGYPEFVNDKVGKYCGRINAADIYLSSANVTQLSGIVYDDLAALGNDCIIKTTSKSTAINTPSSYKVFCFRISTKYEDYNRPHFMKYDRSLDAWLHKPDDSAILKYKYSPTTSRVWTDERQLKDGPAPGYVNFDSTIYYFAYSASHRYSVASQGDSSAHIMECDGCGKTMRQAHVLNAATNSCKICGRKAPFTSVKSIPVDDVLSTDVLLPSSEALYNEAHVIKKDNQ